MAAHGHLGTLDVRACVSDGGVDLLASPRYLSLPGTV